MSETSVRRLTQSVADTDWVTVNRTNALSYAEAMLRRYRRDDPEHSYRIKALCLDRESRLYLIQRYRHGKIQRSRKQEVVWAIAQDEIAHENALRQAQHRLDVGSLLPDLPGVRPLWYWPQAAQDGVKLVAKEYPFHYWRNTPWSREAEETRQAILKLADSLSSFYKLDAMLRRLAKLPIAGIERTSNGERMMFRMASREAYLEDVARFYKGHTSKPLPGVQKSHRRRYRMAR